MSENTLINVRKPKVSVLLPNLNNYPFLEERIKSIQNQTFTDWELIVVDSYSEDGAWELFQEYAKKDSRLRISQAPRKGIYVGINDCIRLAGGEYIYIATSDDTMMPDCLDKMLTAMEAHPECNICHCCLKVIDEKGRELREWWHKLPSQKFYKDMINKKHIRFAPYDGILYCALDTIYTSLTQLLIRRSVFEQVGLSRTESGAKNDFEWGMRASLVCNTLHVPETLTTWRIHSQQATNSNNHTSFVHRKELIEMVKAALPILKKYNPEFYQKLNFKRLFFVYKRQKLRLGLKEKSQIIDKIKYTLSFLYPNPFFLAEFLYRRTFFPRNQTDDFTYIINELKRLGLEDNIKIIQ